MPPKKTKHPLHIKWRHAYLALLTEEIPSPPKGSPEEREMLNLMRELIDGDYAAGSYDYGLDGEVCPVIWEGPTAKGRLFAEDIEEHLKKQTLTYRIKIGVFALIGWFAGIASAWIGSLFK